MRGARPVPWLVMPAALAVALAGSALAQDDPVDERVRLLQRDQQLIQQLVDSGVRLAAEDDPLRRADHCNRLADRLGKEIKQAMAKKDSQRAAHFSKHMQALLVRGVAGNLAIVKDSLESKGSNVDRETELLRLSKEISKVTQDIEDEVNSHPELDRDQITLKAVTESKTRIEQAIKGKGK